MEKCEGIIALESCSAALRATTSETLIAPNLVRTSSLLHGILQSSYVWLFEHRALTPCMLSSYRSL